MLMEIPFPAQLLLFICH